MERAQGSVAKTDHPERVGEREDRSEERAHAVQRTAPWIGQPKKAAIGTDQGARVEAPQTQCVHV